MLHVKWIRCGDDGHYCSFEKLDLSTVKTHGIYVIWHKGNPSRPVRIGQGDVAKRLAAHRLDEEVMACRKFGALRVTWAAVSAAQRDGVEAYLADQYPPLIGDAFPDVAPIAVNSPWS